ncbi:MAG: hypothetical protein KatS3mg105_3109 [Gemmatales bacterium]|nr:MAG: hypothetical protein KatS3mg105_3109 [Gemmatales bacterium]
MTASGKFGGDSNSSSTPKCNAGSRSIAPCVSRRLAAYPAIMFGSGAVRDAIYEDIMAKGYDHERHTFVQYYGTDALDAANLIMPLVLFISPTDPRYARYPRPDHGGTGLRQPRLPL